MTDPGALTPSVEAILHAIIPFTFVDHTHADAVVAVSNTPGGEARIREIYGRPGAGSALRHARLRVGAKGLRVEPGLDWSRYEGMVLLHHGIFSWGTTPTAVTSG